MSLGSRSPFVHLHHFLKKPAFALAAVVLPSLPWSWACGWRRTAGDTLTDLVMGLAGSALAELVSNSLVRSGPVSGR